MTTTIKKVDGFDAVVEIVVNEVMNPQTREVATTTTYATFSKQQVLQNIANLNQNLVRWQAMLDLINTK